VLSSLLLGTEEIPWCDAVTDLGVVIDILIVRLQRCVQGFMPHCTDCVCEVLDAIAGHLLFTRRNELLGVLLFDYYDFRVLSFFFKLILTQ
jgi:hypothetical protein